MRIRFLPVAAVLLFAWDARADLTVTWSCYVPNGRVDCAVVKSSLTSRIPFIKVTNDVERADAAITNLR